MTKLSHIDLNVSDYRRSILFYDMVLIPLGWKRILCQKEVTTYSDGAMKICISPTDSKFVKDGFHRKRTGLNHLAFYASSQGEVEAFYKNVMQKNGITALYEEGPYGDSEYFAVFFEDPDRMKLEVVYSPNYCHPEHWTNTFESDFDPYSES